MKRHVEAAVEDALVAFCGKRRNPLFDREPWKDPCDERLWANFVWSHHGNPGWKYLQELTCQGISEMAQKKHPVPDADKPKILQNIINHFIGNETMRKIGDIAYDGRINPDDREG